MLTARLVPGTLAMVITTETVIEIHLVNLSGRFLPIPILIPTATTTLIPTLIIQHQHEAIRLPPIAITTVLQHLQEAVAAVAGVAVVEVAVGQADRPGKQSVKSFFMGGNGI